MIKKIFGKKENAPEKKYSQQDIDKIKERAYFIWLNKGKPNGSSASDWILAEKELKKEGKI
ncbi:MAG: DUF2934 domain-containing protein [Candidatus Omnitrophica bacterium]|nr:DUF2934 domain-containing protein [Candidatus Omnitrophota bacterium]